MNDNSNGREYRPAKRILWGIVLIAAGVLFLVDRLDIYEIDDIWHYWPYIITLAGAIELLTARQVQDVTRGLMNIVIGVWLDASIENRWGLNFANSWPILMIAFGVMELIKGFAVRVKNSYLESQK